MGGAKSSMFTRNKRQGKIALRGQTGIWPASQVVQQEELVPDAAEVVGSDPGPVSAPLPLPFGLRTFTSEHPQMSTGSPKVPKLSDHLISFAIFVSVACNEA